MLKRGLAGAPAPVISPIFAIKPFAGGVLEAGFENIETLFGGSVEGLLCG